MKTRDAVIKQKIRVLVVDDSALMRKKITEMINRSVDCEVIGTARDGLEALQVIQILKPDVITLDLELPKMDGLVCLGCIMSEWPTPVVIVSGTDTEQSNMVLQALEYGAVAFVAKPSGVISLDIEKVREELLAKIRLAHEAPLDSLRLLWLKNPNQVNALRPSFNKLIAIGASTGGPGAVAHILSALPGDLKACILIVQHMPQHFIHSFAERLNNQSALLVKEAGDKEPLEGSKVLIAPSGFMMTVKSQGKQALIHLEKDAILKHRISPSIDATFLSVAEVYREHSVGIILTGMGKDGTEGCRRIKQCRGKTIAQDKSSCIVFGMPSAAIAAGAVDEIIPLAQIPQAILDEVGGIDGK